MSLRMRGIVRAMDSGRRWSVACGPGVMVIPVGGFFQELKVFRKGSDGNVTEKDILPVRFVPMTGEVEKTPTVPEN